MLDGTVNLQCLLRYAFFPNSSSKILTPDLPPSTSYGFAELHPPAYSDHYPHCHQYLPVTSPSCLLIMPVLIAACIPINHGYVYIR